MNELALVLYVGASLAAGIMNTLAGGGSFLTFPALLLTGLDPRAANITSTLALFPMQLSTGYAGRKLAGGTPQLTLRTLMIISFIGGAGGALLLLITPPAAFARLVPWLIMIATGLFAYGSFFRKPAPPGQPPSLSHRQAMAAQFAISIYGGYFGGGIGFLMLAALTLAGVSIRQAGATKNILAGIMNASAVLIFVFSHDVGWVQAGCGAVASMLGGVAGVYLLRYVNERWLRAGIVMLGTVLTVAMFFY